MWQLFYLIDFLPDLLWHVLTLVSFVLVIVTTTIKIIPYRFPISLFSGLVFAFCLWIQGGLANEQKWLAEVAALQEKVREAEQKAQIVNQEIRTEIVEKERVVVKRGETIIKEVDRIVEKVVEIEKLIEKEIPGPERVREITKDMTAEQRRAYEEEIAQLRRDQKEKIVEITKEVTKEITKDMTAEQKQQYLDEIDRLRRLQSQECAIPKSLIDLYNQAAKNPNRSQEDKK